MRFIPCSRLTLRSFERLIQCLTLCVVVAMAAGGQLQAQTPALPLDPGAVITGPTFNNTKGVWSYSVTSPFQSGSNVIEVLLPDTYSSDKKYQVVYVLPVQPGTGTNFGDGLQVVRATGYHNTYDVICVQPTFTTFPWFADHSTNATMRHESYMNKVVLPLIEQSYSTQRSLAGRLLIGFSKSGWGAFALLMRNPETYGFAASWDAPMLMDYGSYSTGTVFADNANFEQYSPEILAQNPNSLLLTSRRLLLSGDNLFGSEPGGAFASNPHTTTYHAQLAAKGIPHLYIHKVTSNHLWSADWTRPTLEGLIELSRGGGTGAETTLLSANFEAIPVPTVLTAPKLTAAGAAGKWVLSDPRNTGLRETPGDTALLMESSGRGYSLRALLATPFVIGRTGSLSFDVAVKNGYGTATSGYGRDRDNFIIGMDEFGNQIFRIAVLAWDSEGRLAYQNASGAEVWLGNATNNIRSNSTNVYDPALMRTVRIDFKPTGMDIYLRGVQLAENVPYNTSGKRICEIFFLGESFASSIYYNHFLFTTESGFATWQKAQWPGESDPAVIGPLARPMGDQITNLEKYATGLSTQEPALSSTEGFTQNEERLALRFSRAGSATDVTYHVQASSNLTDWETIWSDRNALIGGDGQIQTEEVADLVSIGDGPRRFLRLKITMP